VSNEDKRTVHIAGAANGLIALAKLAAGLLSGSKAILAEFAHSVADTMDQVFLRVSLSRGEKEPDEDHPFGYGKERFFWAFLTAVFIFMAGAIFSIGQGVLALLGVLESGNSAYVFSWIVLGISFLAEGTSWLRAFGQARREANETGMPLLEFVRVSPNPTVKTVLLEDSAAVIGIVIAAVGVGLHQLTGNMVYDAGAAILIGCLLAFVAVGLGRNTKGLLLGVSARPEIRRKLREVIESHDEVDELLQLLTMWVGPDSLLVAARFDPADDVDADRVEQLADEIEEDLRHAVPEVGEVFLDPTPAHRHRRRHGTRLPGSTAEAG
jgi:cation diffusion facilitator family transporter